ncbi:AzlC family ABC transporter permease, partial [Vallitalea maricola]|uniref:AzlC family ABC transporter permease n=1 Tax=Vallitalea maricola TaxID=3074433 RepID=UPI0033657311
MLTTLLVNMRHMLMSASLASRLTKDMKKWSPLIAFGITDETFSVSSFKKGTLTKEYMLSLELIA